MIEELREDEAYILERFKRGGGGKKKNNTTSKESDKLVTSTNEKN